MLASAHLDQDISVLAAVLARSLRRNQQVWYLPALGTPLRLYQ